MTDSVKALKDAQAVRKEAAGRLETAQAEYVAALSLAVKEHGARKCADELGVTRQRVYSLLPKVRPADSDETEILRLEARLIDLDARYDLFVTKLGAAQVPGETWRKAEQAAKNGNRRRKSAKRHGALRTVTEEAQAFAETKFLRYLHDNPEVPLVQRVVAELDEASALRKQLETLTDARAGIPLAHTPDSTTMLGAHPARIG